MKRYSFGVSVALAALAVLGLTGPAAAGDQVPFTTPKKRPEAAVRFAPRRR
jgi:hypothetical protein